MITITPTTLREYAILVSLNISEPGGVPGLDAWRDRRAVGFVLATSAADAKRAARARTDYYRARGCDGHPGVHVWPDPELATAPVGCRFQLGGERVRFEDEAAKAAGRTT